MTLSIHRLALAPLVVGLLALAGCGSPSSNRPAGSAGASSATAVAPSPVAAPTQPPITPAVITGGSTAAIINGHNVPMSEFRFLYQVNQHRAAGQPGTGTKVLAEQTMTQVILDEIIREYAVAHHLSVSASEVNQLVQRDEAQAGGLPAFKRSLARFSMTVADYERLVKPALLTQKVQNVVVPPDTTVHPTAHVRHILIATAPTGKKPRTDAQAHALAITILGKLQHGGDFAALARTYSDDPGSAAAGGDLGNVYPHETVPSFDHAAFTQKLKQFAIVHSRYGYHIIEVLSRGSGPLPPQQQQQVQQQAFQQWLSARMTTAKVKKLAKVQK